MMFRRPPALANWLLDRFGNTRQNPALAGDLLEEFRNGRSAAWYWRQSLRVIANGIASNVVERRPYLLSLSAAYAIQLVVALVLCRMHAPPPIKAALWIKVGVYVLLQVTFAGCERFVNRLVVGESSPDMKGIYCASGSGTPRSTILSLAAFHSFYAGLASYCICALVLLPRISVADLLSLEMTWFVLWIITPALAPLSATTIAFETVEEAQTPRAIPESEPRLPVILSGGRVIVLEPQSFAQTVFASADQELITVVFGQSRDLELLRRSVWLGACRGSAKGFTLVELADMIDETAGNKPIRPEGFRQRLRLGFRGDPA
jgi:hypothetical protein